VVSRREGLLRYGARSGAIFTVAGLIQRGTPLLLLPLYATALSPDQYGQIALVVAVTTVLGALLGLGLESTVIRETVRLADDASGRQRFLNTVGIFATVAPLLAAVLAWGVLSAVGFFGVPSELLLLGVLATALQTTTTVFIGAAIRAQERLGAYLALTAVQAVGIAGTTLVLVLGLQMGTAGWLAGSLVGSVVGFLVGLVILGHRWSATFASPILRAALLFGLPLVPHTVSHWALNLSDRLVLANFVDDASVGIYNLAYQVAAPISLLVVAMHQGVMPIYARAARDPDVRAGLRKVATFHVHFAAWLGLSAALLAPVVIVALFPGTYHNAAGLVPWIALGYVLFGFYVVPMDSLSLMIGRTRWLWVPTLFAAATNVTLNVALVPRFGVIAAAVDTPIAYMALLGGVVIARLRIGGPRIEYESTRIAAGVLILLALGVIGLVGFPALDNIGSIVARVLLVVVGGVAVAVFAYLSNRGASAAGTSTQVGGAAVECRLEAPYA
jgi:O-antigen/teichoic acid export membrane protein